MFGLIPVSLDIHHSHDSHLQTQRHNATDGQHMNVQKGTSFYEKRDDNKKMSDGFFGVMLFVYGPER